MDGSCVCCDRIHWCHGNHNHLFHSQAYIYNNTNPACLRNTNTIYTYADQPHIRLNLVRRTHPHSPCGTYILPDSCRVHHLDTFDYKTLKEFKKYIIYNRKRKENEVQLKEIRKCFTVNRISWIDDSFDEKI